MNIKKIYIINIEQLFFYKDFFFLIYNNIINITDNFNLIFLQIVLSKLFIIFYLKYYNKNIYFLR